jgi:hypothetical protein
LAIALDGSASPGQALAAVGKKLTAVSWQQAVKNKQHFSRSD